MKKLGHCSACDSPCFEIVRKFVGEHPLAGHPAQLGAPMDNAWRVTLLLTGGSFVDVTFCEGCVDGIYVNLPDLWRRCVERTAWEIEAANRAAIGAGPLTPEQAEEATRYVARMMNDVPVGVLARQKWKEVDG